jgi:hypothetical protein
MKREVIGAQTTSCGREPKRARESFCVAQTDVSPEATSSHTTMKVVPPNQITTECMDCGRQSIGPRLATAPKGAALYVIHCGCDVSSTRGEPYYIDGDGELME